MGHASAIHGITVDAPGARDRDDALWAERVPGGFVATVCVTDVASLVARDSPDDLIAAARGLNFYRDGGRSAMFGEHVTARLASLDPRVPRRVVAHRISFSSSGEEISSELFRTTFRSREALAYAGFDSVLATPDAPLRPMCEAALELAQILFRRRVAAVGMPDWDSAFDETGAIRDGAPPGAIGQSVVNEFMVAANSAATRYLRERGRPMIYRNQGPRPGGPGGRYEVVCHGHDGLAVEAYAQFTSPLRNYVNLVNQRAVCAGIEDRPPPHSMAEHSRICAAANLAAQRSDALARSKAQASAEREPGALPIERLDPFAFRRLIRQRRCLDRHTLRDFRRRVDGGLLTHGDAAWLLFDASSPLDGASKWEILARLAASPGEFDRIWRIAQDEHGIPAFEAETVRSGRLWLSVASVRRHVGEASGSDPVKTRELALLRLAASGLGLPDVPGATAESLGMRFVDTRARGRLEALCRTAGWDRPTFAFEERGEGARKQLTLCQVTVPTDSFVYVSPRSWGSHRHAAEMAAAELAVAALAPYAEDVLANDMREGGIDLRTLDEDATLTGAAPAVDAFCLRYGARQRWIWTRERPSTNSFGCVLELSADGSTLRSPGWGRTREDARATAASSAIDTLLGRGCAPEARAPECEASVPEHAPGAA